MIKILHVEDSVNDAELARELFTQEWPGCEVDRVDSWPDYVARLSTSVHDLILSDFSLGSFDALEALRLAHAMRPETPFIFFSGTIGEERALAALRAGARDYVLKDRPQRLLAAIQRALDESRMRRERRESAAQLQRVQRLENLGMLAAGIAHDFNNVLAPVMMGISLLRMRVTEERDIRVLDNMEGSAERGAGLVRQIMGFSNGVAGEIQDVQPKHVIREVAALAEQTFPKSVHVELELPAWLCLVRVNPTQLHQVLLNLAVNARDAMPSGGTLTIRAAVVVLSAAEATVHQMASGDYLEIVVGDSGTGIPADVLNRIWEPFFTTKPRDKGTGLGLATVRAIISGYGGVVTVDTAPGQGTRFRILLPAQAGTEAPEKVRGPAAGPQGAGELVIVADHDLAVRELMAATLTAGGYRVMTAKDGVEALARLSSRQGTARVLVAGANMANIGGESLAHLALSLNPEIAVIVMSGSAESEALAESLPPGARFLAKPCSSEKLLGTLHEMLVRQA